MTCVPASEYVRRGSSGAAAALHIVSGVTLPNGLAGSPRMTPLWALFDTPLSLVVSPHMPRPHRGKGASM